MDTVKDPATGRFYKREVVFCGKERCKKCAKGEGHGPYWYSYWWEGGKTRKKYIGKTLPASLTQDSEESYVRDKGAPLPKTDDLHKTSSLTQDEPLPKTPLPKTEDGEVVARALEAIRDFHSRGIEPSVSEVADVVGAPPKHLGRWVKDAAGLEAQNIRRPGKKRARRYLIPTK